MPYFVFLLALLSVLPTKAQTERSEGIRLSYTATDSCRYVSLLYYSHSTHPGGNRYGLLNENNHGIGFRCRQGDQSPLYYTLSGIYNSQFGSTFVAGPGVAWTVLRFGPVSFDIGVEIPFVYYESPVNGNTCTASCQLAQSD